MEHSKEAGEQAVDSIRYDTRWGNNSCQSGLVVVIESAFCMKAYLRFQLINFCQPQS